MKFTRKRTDEPGAYGDALRNIDRSFYAFYWWAIATIVAVAAVVCGAAALLGRA
jgi:hypothetical protein